MAMAHVINPKPAEAVDVFFSGDVSGGLGAGVAPFDDGRGVLDRSRFAVFEKSRVHMIAETVNGLSRDPLRVFRSDVRFCDEIQHPLGVGEYLAVRPLAVRVR